MLLLLSGLALAQDPATVARDEIRLPLTPSEGHDVYMGVFDHPRADVKSWTSDTDGFTCEPDGDLLQVVVRRETWPSVVPSKVTCTADDGRRVKARVVVDAIKHQAMFVADGTLVMPREKGNSVIYAGPPPQGNVVVGTGKSGSLSVRCEVKPGPELRVTVDPENDDGVGMCALQDNNGKVVKVPIRIVTVK
jgi:hypothetical protein